jgi:hypothetical protein
MAERYALKEPNQQPTKPLQLPLAEQGELNIF